MSTSFASRSKVCGRDHRTARECDRTVLRGAVAVPLDIEFSGPGLGKQPSFAQVINWAERDAPPGRGPGPGPNVRGRRGQRVPVRRRG
ncbi:hypothetical protein Scel_03680 [Streptomyces cellostaticus]|nr:hypothetical protein Scel_03680 [Streptomyces cellostaticus]